MSELALALLLLLAPPAKAAPSAPAIPDFLGPWTGEVTLVSRAVGGQVATEQMAATLTLVVQGNRVNGATPQNGCRFAGTIAPAPALPGQKAATLSVAASNCRSPSFNRAFTGTLNLPGGASLSNLTLQATQAGMGYEVFGLLQRVDKRPAGGGR